MKSNKRAERRHHKERMKQKAREVFHWLPDEACDIDPAKWADHLKMTSSCLCCGNPRRMYKKSEQKTRQERKFDLKRYD